MSSMIKKFRIAVPMISIITGQDKGVMRKPDSAMVEVNTNEKRIAKRSVLLGRTLNPLGHALIASNVVIP